MRRCGMRSLPCLCTNGFGAGLLLGPQTYLFICVCFVFSCEQSFDDVHIATNQVKITQNGIGTEDLHRILLLLKCVLEVLLRDDDILTSSIGRSLNLVGAPANVAHTDV